MVEGELVGLNLKQALGAHQAWKGRLQKVLDGECNENLDIATVSQDTHCKWNYSEWLKRTRNPFAFNQLLLWLKLLFIRHFWAGFYPITQIQIGQT